MKKTFKDRSGNEYTLNMRLKLDRYLDSLPEENLFFANGQMRITVKDGYINLGDYGFDYYYNGGHRWSEYETKQDYISALKKVVEENI